MRVMSAKNRMTRQEGPVMSLPNTLVALLAGATIAAGGIAQAEPQRFESPDDAAEAVAAALEARDRDGLIAIFGPESEDVILTGDPERDRTDWGAFLESYNEMNRTAVEEDGTATLYVGRGQWPFPVPLVEGTDGWSFDPAAAAEEIRLRRIGRNELDVIDLMRAYVDVQSRYRRTDWDGDGVMEFAAHIVSSEGTRDGLYWPEAEGAPESPVGDFVARATAIGYSIGGEAQEPEPFLGYYFHILQKQGENAPGGAMDYMVGGNMVVGHALIAYPADYDQTGIMSFIVGENGTIHEADLGENTIESANAIDSFDPGEGWEPIE